MGVDYMCGLFKFVKGKLLGINGLWWFKIYFVNVYGFDKVSLVECEEFVNENF